MVSDSDKPALARRMRSEGCLQREIAAALGISPPTASHEQWNLLTLCKRCHDAFHKAAGGHVRVAIGPFFSEETEVREPQVVYCMAA